MNNGWAKRSIDDICVFRGGGTPSKKKASYWKGDIPWVSPKDMKSDIISDSIDHITTDAIEQSTTNLIPADSILVVVRSGILARTIPVGITGRDVTINQDIKALCPNGSVDAWFLFYFLKSRLGEMLALASRGATVHRIMADQIRQMDILVPPLPEQRRIVGILDAAFDGIATAKANAEKNLQNARALFESHLNAVFTDAWKQGELVTLSDLASGITDGDHLPPPKSPTGIPFITIGNIVKDTRTIDFSDTFKVPRDYFDGVKPIKKPKKGDVLFTVTGSFGIPVLVNDNREFCFQRHIGLIRPKAETNSAWLYYLLMSPQVFKQANDRATGTAQKTVSLKVLRTFDVPKLPLDEQTPAVAKLNALSAETKRLESIYQRKLAALDELKKSLLHQAFSGQL